MRKIRKKRSALYKFSLSKLCKINISQLKAVCNKKKIVKLLNLFQIILPQVRQMQMTIKILVIIWDRHHI